jgi:hypothetical protein
MFFPRAPLEVCFLCFKGVFGVCYNIDTRIMNRVHI